MRRDVDGDEGIAGRTSARGIELAFETDLLAIGEPRRDLDFDLITVGKLHEPRATLGRLCQCDSDLRGDVLTAHARRKILELGAVVRAFPTPGLAEYVLEDVVDAAK